MADFELLLEKYQNKSLRKDLFIESIMASQMHSKPLKILFNESKLWKQICIKLTFILFEEVLKSTELVL